MTTDAVLAAAHDVARTALLEATDESTVGDHLRVVDDGERLATHLFACTGPGYRGWTWAVRPLGRDRRRRGQRERRGAAAR